MSFLSEKTIKSSHLNAEPETGQGGATASPSLESAEQVGSNVAPHLEDILGRINSIMSDASGAIKSSNQSQSFVSPDPAAPSYGRDHHAFDADHQAERSAFYGGPSPGEYGLGEQQPGGQRYGGQGFVASEPSDMLKPYSEVLGEVRDYFNERHSLDPSNSLLNSQPTSSLTDEMRRVAREPVGGAFNSRPASAHQWGEEVELKFQEAVALESEAPAVAEGSRDIFSPIKFANPFDRESERDRASMEVLAPEAEGFKRLRNDLVDRIAQLEQVIGHHFGDRKEVATEAAQAAIRMTLQNLDDTTLGRRLADIETAFILFQKNQDQKNQETRQTLMKMGAELRKVSNVVEGVPVACLLPEGANSREGKLGISNGGIAGENPTSLQVSTPVPAKPETMTPNLILTPVHQVSGAQPGAPDGISVQEKPGALGGLTSQGMSAPQAEQVPQVNLSPQVKLASQVAQSPKVSQPSNVNQLPQVNEAPSETKGQSNPAVNSIDQKAGVYGADVSTPEKSAGMTEFSQPLDYMIGDIQVPSGAGLDEGQALATPSGDAGLVLPPKLPFEDDVDGFPQVITGPVDGRADNASSLSTEIENDAALRDSPEISSGVSSIEQMRKLLKESGEPRDFGKSDKSRNAMGMSVTPAEVAQLEGDVELDDYLQKSAALRAQFKQAKIVSNDDDLHSMERKGSRIAVGVIVVTLVLAAVGVAIQNDTQGLKNLLNTIVIKVKDFSGTLKLPDRLEPHTSLSEVVPGGEKALKHSELRNASGDADMTITGNINGADKKIHSLDGASERARSETETALGAVLLPAVEGSDPGLPPALIGPYSLRHAASKGDVAAQYEVARRFGLGQGVPRDHEQAVKWYMLAAAQGFAPAQYRLATYYERGRGVAKNLERAKVWYKRASELGNVKAMHNLAVVSTALTQGDADYKMAIEWFNEAANRNLADSQFNLAILYQNGVGLKKDLIESFKWFSLAARQGDLDAAVRRDGLEKLLTKKELFEASKLLQKWEPLEIDKSANKVGGIVTHLTSTMSHADETITRSRVLTAQILLRKLGYGLDEADGDLNDQTIMAIKKFEKDKGLPITGKVSGDLLKFLNKASL